MYYKNYFVNETETELSINKIVQRLKESHSVKQVTSNSRYIAGKDEIGNEFTISCNNFSPVYLDILIRANSMEIIEKVEKVVFVANEINTDIPIEDNYTVLKEINNHIKSIKIATIFIATIVGVFILITLINGFF